MAVVLNFNDSAATLACVASLVDGNESDHIIVVDNGSEARDRAALEEGLAGWGQSVTSVFTGENLGFGAGMNRGIEVALRKAPDGILLLNNDTLVESGTITALQESLDSDQDIGVAVPLVTTGPQGERVWAAGGQVEGRTLKVRHREAAQGSGRSLPAADVSFAPGAALLLRPDVLREIGGFVEEFFLYVEDVELSLRITDAGYRIRFVPKARVWHAVQGGHQQRSMNSIYFRTRNSLWLARRRLPRAWLLLIVPLLVLRGLRVVQQKSGRQPALVLEGIAKVGSGTVDGLRPSQPTGKLAPHRFS